MVFYSWQSSVKVVLEMTDLHHSCGAVIQFLTQSTLWDEEVVYIQENKMYLKIISAAPQA